VPWLVITDPFPPSFNLGPVPIRFYGLAYAIAFIAGTAVAGRHLARRGVPSNVTNDIAFWAIVFGLIGARLYFDVQSGWWFYLTHRSTSSRSGKAGWRSSARSSPPSPSWW